MSIRDALARKRIRRATYMLPVDDATAAEERLQAARQELVLAGIGKDDNDPAKAKAQAKVDEAQAAVDACYVPLVMQGIPAADFEALLAAHPSKSDDPDDMWDKDSLAPELVSACLVDNDMSADEWRAELASERWTRGDVDQLFLTAMSVNLKASGQALGKG